MRAKITFLITKDSNSLKRKIYKFAQSFNLNYKRNILSKVTFENAKVLDYSCRGW